VDERLSVSGVGHRGSSSTGRPWCKAGAVADLALLRRRRARKNRWGAQDARRAHSGAHC
jgi:hypothetical protein